MKMKMEQMKKKRLNLAIKLIPVLIIIIIPFESFSKEVNIVISGKLKNTICSLLIQHNQGNNRDIDTLLYNSELTTEYSTGIAFNMTYELNRKRNYWFKIYIGKKDFSFYPAYLKNKMTIEFHISRNGLDLIIKKKKSGLYY
ncbi:hypothetical protein K6119_07085 [Paracrocinitomix mangrovi]|uniref:hypothetical protein n=1 Tax=Paracrocinitomix mangrovi TaxID=2862509 RepID=UPI001C8D086A|nr:hypothetical protein [Paracrocinitomix mangrovi]UKN03276.1 hypothetical protein K6119_07085 [Paracrocinitomix mangrovi]